MRIGSTVGLAGVPRRPSAWSGRPSTGVYALSIAYPTVARGKARVRTMPSAAHAQEDLETALAAFKRVRDRLMVTP